MLDPADAECSLDPSRNLLVEQQLTYFCGSAADCLKLGSARALNRAKMNLEMGYAVVGVAGLVSKNKSSFAKK